jgi:hypothetical protein
MTVLDNPQPFDNDEASVSMFPTALRYGLAGSVLFVIYTLISHLLGLTVPSSMSMMALQFMLSLTLTILILYFAVRHHRDQELGGYISFGRAFMVGLIVLSISVVVNNLFSLLYMTVIDPGYVDTVMESTEEMMLNLGVDDEMIEEQMEAARERMKPTSMLLQGILGGVVMSAVISAIMAAIMKRNPGI